MNLQIVNADLLTSDTDYIAHQCNSSHNRNFGLSSVISKMYPKANIYNGKYEALNRIPGTIIIRDKVIAMIAQVSQGKPKKPETKLSRQQLFQSCLDEIAKIPNIKSIAFPYCIGCGLAGGDWDKYLTMISNWCVVNSHINVKIYRVT
jgi:O-acetyl-ADP-ribose deacetylase (regulator of RNase III)